MGRPRAMLIATYEYRDTGLRRLEAPAADVESLAAVLQDPEIAGFDVTTLINQPHHVVGEAIGDFCRSHRPDDLTLLYFTGHGLKDARGRLHLAMSNTRRDNLGFTSLPAEQLHQAMQDSRSRQMVLILDCCYSGAFPAGLKVKADDQAHALEVLQGRGRTVLTASDAMQYSFEGEQLHGVGARSVFTRCLVDGLRDGSADLDHDGNITVDELYAYVYDRVVEETPQQRPKKQDDIEGRTIIARNINWRLPDHLRHALNSPLATERLAVLDWLEHLCRIGSKFVRESALNEMQKLIDDDSRMVSASAGTRLRALRSPTSPPERIYNTTTRATRSVNGSQRSTTDAVPSRREPNVSSNHDGAERPVDPRVELLARHLASLDDDELDGEMVGPLLNINVAPRTGRRLLGQARELVNRRAQAEGLYVPNVDAVAVRRAWPKILEEAKKLDFSTGVLLANAAVKTVSNETLLLTTPTAMLAQRLSEQRATKVITDALHTAIGVNWQVQCDLAERLNPQES